MAKKREWEIQPHDIRWNGFEASFIVKDGWEPFAVSAVPNTLDPNQIRLWTRRPRVWYRLHDRFKWLRDMFKKKPWEIKIQSAGWGGHQVGLHLNDGWEPFAVTDSFGNHIIWFKRKEG